MDRRSFSKTGFFEEMRCCWRSIGSTIYIWEHGDLLQDEMFKGITPLVGSDAPG